MLPVDSTARPKGLLLVVDDQPFMAHYMRLVLEYGDGHDVAVAFNLEDAWALFQREVSRVRAVLTDLLMPDGGGLELARRVHEAAPNMPVLLVTGHPLSEPLGPNCSLLEKPFGPDVLQAAVRQVIEASG